MRVHEGLGRNGGWEMHVEISDIVTHPKSWGTMLAAIAHTIAPTLAKANGMTLDEVMCWIKGGFNNPGPPPEPRPRAVTRQCPGRRPGTSRTAPA